MLNEKQLMALDDTHRMLRDVVYGHSYQLQSWGDEILKVLSDLADARLARQRLERPLAAARDLMDKWDNHFPISSSSFYGEMKIVLEEADDDATL